MNRRRVFQPRGKVIDGSSSLSGMAILRNRFAGDNMVEGYRKNGPVGVARCDFGEDSEAGKSEERMLRRREISDVIEQLLVRINLEETSYGNLP